MTSGIRIAITCLVICFLGVAANADLLGASLSLVSESQLAVDLSGKQNMPRWTGGTLNLLEGNKTAAVAVSSFDRQGRVLSNAVFSIPEARWILVDGYTRGSDGTVALCGLATDAAGRASAYVGWVSPKGDIQLVRTFPYMPFLVAVASDGSIWTQGFEYLTGQRGKLNPDAAVFRRFDRAGRMIGAFVPQSQIRGQLSLISVVSLFDAIGDGVAWYSDYEQAYIQLGPTGVVSRINSLPLPNDERVNGFAITESGGVFISSRGAISASISRLDLVARSWVPLQQVHFTKMPPPETHSLYGAEGENLVAWDWGFPPYRRLRFFKVTQ